MIRASLSFLVGVISGCVGMIVVGVPFQAKGKEMEPAFTIIMVSDHPRSGKESGWELRLDPHGDFWNDLGHPVGVEDFRESFRWDKRPSTLPRYVHVSLKLEELTPLCTLTQALALIREAAIPGQTVIVYVYLKTLGENR
jgi:hypothetical protein